MRSMSDADCTATWGKRKGNGGERFDPARMLCATDTDGLAPLSSGCNGDSGGPLLAGPAAAPVLLGVVSWGSPLCGADHLPSVFAEVAHYRSFITASSPVWAPLATTPARVSGDARVGGRLTCTASGFAGTPDRLRYSWQRQGGRGAQIVGHRRTYTVPSRDAGAKLVCDVEATNAGGRSITPYVPGVSDRKIPR